MHVLIEEDDVLIRRLLSTSVSASQIPTRARQMGINDVGPMHG